MSIGLFKVNTNAVLFLWVRAATQTTLESTIVVRVTWNKDVYFSRWRVDLFPPRDVNAPPEDESGPSAADRQVWSATGALISRTPPGGESRLAPLDVRHDPRGGSNASAESERRKCAPAKIASKFEPRNGKFRRLRCGESRRTQAGARPRNHPSTRTRLEPAPLHFSGRRAW